MSNRFWRVNVEITNICNLQCTFCPEVVRTKNLVSPEQFRKTIEQVAPLTRVVTLHLMGDPLVHPKLQELVDICAEHDLQIFFVTNGVLLREKEMEILFHPAFRQVSFSLHSFKNNFPSAEPTEYLERIFRFTETAFERKPELFINYRLWNLDSPYGKETNNSEMLDRVEKRFGVKVPAPDMSVKKSFNVKKRLSLHFETEFIWPALDLPLLGEHGTCHGLKSHIGVLVDGSVVPCCLDKEGTIKLGNLYTTPLNEILGSPRAQKMMAGFKKNELVEELCKRCQYIQRFSETA